MERKTGRAYGAELCFGGRKELDLRVVEVATLRDQKLSSRIGDDSVGMNDGIGGKIE